MGVPGHVISCFEDCWESALLTFVPVLGPTSLAFRRPPDPWETPCWRFPSPGCQLQVTCTLDSYEDSGQVLCNSSIDHCGWRNVVVTVGYQRCSKRVTWTADVSAQLTVAWQLAESPNVVVALDCQNVTYPAELETKQALYQLHPQSEPEGSFSAHLHPRNETPRVHKPATRIHLRCVVANERNHDSKHTKRLWMQKDRERWNSVTQTMKISPLNTVMREVRLWLPLPPV